MAQAASGRPAPRNALVELVLVTTDVPGHVHDRDPIDTGRRRPQPVGDERAHCRVGAAVLKRVDFVGLDRSVAVCPDPDLMGRCPAVAHRQHRLAAGLVPAHGATQLSGRPHDRPRLRDNNQTHPWPRIRHRHRGQSLAPFRSPSRERSRRRSGLRLGVANTPTWCIDRRRARRRASTWFERSGLRVEDGAERSRR